MRCTQRKLSAQSSNKPRCPGGYSKPSRSHPRCTGSHGMQAAPGAKRQTAQCSCRPAYPQRCLATRGQWLPGTKAAASARPESPIPALPAQATFAYRCFSRKQLRVHNRDESSSCHDIRVHHQNQSALLLTVVQTHLLPRPPRTSRPPTSLDHHPACTQRNATRICRKMCIEPTCSQPTTNQLLPPVWMCRRLATGCSAASDRQPCGPGASSARSASFWRWISWISEL